MSIRDRARDILEKADITIGGDRPWDIVVHDERLYSRALRGGSLAFGEAYMDGWWSVPALDQFFDKFLSAGLNEHAEGKIVGMLRESARYVYNFQSKARAHIVGEKHYDIGNDLYRAMLDRRMVYTCGYFEQATTLEDAQEAKLDLVCRKIGLRKGDRVLDIGCGWGSFAKFAAERYGAEVVGLTISKEQAALARAECVGLPIEIRLQDYREVQGVFDHVISIGMFEAVGAKNFRTYMETVRRVLKPDGLFLLHTIGGNHSTLTTDAWLDRYIFPNGMLPSIAQIGKSIEGLFVMEDWHNFGAYYDRTLMEWHARFQTAWPELSRAEKYDDRFKRMWEYYLLMCAGSFRSRTNQLWQIVLSPQGVRGGHRTQR